VDGETPRGDARLYRSPACAPRGRRRLSRIREAGVLHLGKFDAPALGIDGAAVVEAVSELHLGDVPGFASLEHVSHGGATTSCFSSCDALAALRVTTAWSRSRPPPRERRMRGHVFALCLLVGTAHRLVPQRSASRFAADERPLPTYTRMMRVERRITMFGAPRRSHLDLRPNDL